MKRMSGVLAVGVLVATLLSGCVIVPLGGWGYGGGYYHHYSYRPYYDHGR